MTERYIKCNKCGGTLGTLIRKGDIYEHMRENDCKKSQARIARKVKILEQAKSLPTKEEKCKQ